MIAKHQFDVVRALVLVFVRRRDLMTLPLIVMLALNAAFTWLIVVASGAESYLQLRYNMRAMPIALAGVAWLFLLSRGRQRLLVWAATFVALLVAVPATAHTMRTFPIQFRERAFVRAVEDGRGRPDELRGARAMARYIDAHVRRKNMLLTDDSQTFAPMLLSGRPELFRDRIDRGDEEWQAALDAPFGRVGYVLVIAGGPDLVLQRYPRIASGSNPAFGVQADRNLDWLDVPRTLRRDSRVISPCGSAVRGSSGKTVGTVDSLLLLRPLELRRAARLRTHLFRRGPSRRRLPMRRMLARQRRALGPAVRQPVQLAECVGHATPASGKHTDRLEGTKHFRRAVRHAEDRANPTGV